MCEVNCANCRVDAFKHGLCPDDFCEKHKALGTEDDFIRALHPERKKDTIQKFHDYQVEWLKSHYDIELEPQLEEMIIRFLHDTANSYMMKIDREEGGQE